jgi:hypothetical protein
MRARTVAAAVGRWAAENQRAGRDGGGWSVDPPVPMPLPPFDAELGAFTAESGPAATIGRGSE